MAVAIIKLIFFMVYIIYWFITINYSAMVVPKTIYPVFNLIIAFMRNIYF
jgi:hypothetical protein